MSQELTERVQHIKVAKMASVANTFPWVLASCKYNTKYLLIHRKTQTHFWPFLMCFARRVHDLADDGVVSGRDGVEDPLDAFELLLVASGDPVEGFIVVLQSSAALTAGNRTNARHFLFPLINDWWHAAGVFHSHVQRISHLHVSHLHQPGEVHFLLHLPVAPDLYWWVSWLQLSLEQQGHHEGRRNCSPKPLNTSSFTNDP